MVWWIFVFEFFEIIKFLVWFFLFYFVCCVIVFKCFEGIEIVFIWVVYLIVVIFVVGFLKFKVIFFLSNVLEFVFGFVFVVFFKVVFINGDFFF